MNAWCTEGLLIVLLLFCCTASYFYRTPRLAFLFATKRGGVGSVPFKAAAAGVRLHAQVAVACALAGAYVLVR